MSASVWFEEVNIGLIEELKKTLTIKDEKGDFVPLPKEAFMVRKPEEDFKFETLPCVSICPLTYRHNPLRYSPYPIEVELDKESKVVTLEDHAVSFDLDYQIDFWADFQTDLDSMTRAWLMKHFRSFNLKVVDDGGVERTCNCFNSTSIVRSDLVQNKKRLFHAVIKYQIWVEIDAETRYNEPVVIDRDFNLSQY